MSSYPNTWGKSQFLGGFWKVSRVETDEPQGE